MLAFFSYQHDERHQAANVAGVFDSLDIDTFMAHENIGVSHEWQHEILDHLRRADFFVALLSARYLGSTYCLQESGIAVFREMPIIPLAIEHVVPPGFMSHIQSRFIDPDNINRSVILSGIARHQPAFVIDHLLDELESSAGWRTAESRFQTLSPFLPQATHSQFQRLFGIAVSNSQVGHAHLVASEYLPPLWAAHRDVADLETQAQLDRILALYRPA